MNVTQTKDKYFINHMQVFSLLCLSRDTKTSSLISSTLYSAVLAQSLTTVIFQSPITLAPCDHWYLLSAKCGGYLTPYVEILFPSPGCNVTEMYKEKNKDFLQ